MSCRSQVVVSPLPTGSCLPQELYEYLSSGLHIVSVCDDCVCFRSQTGSPGLDEQDDMWSLVSSTGVPLFDLTFYNGEWRRYPTVPLGAEVFFSGDPALYFDPVTKYGIHGGQWDGWQVDATDAVRYPVIAQSYSANNWVISYLASLQHTGGVQTIVTDAANTYMPSSTEVTTTKHARGNPGIGNFVLWGDATAGLTTEVLIPPDPGNLAPSTIPIFPTFVGKALVRYVGLVGS